MTSDFSSTTRRVSRVGLIVALAIGAVVSMEAAEVPRVLPAGTVAPNVILIQIRAQRVEPGCQISHEKRAGDAVADGLYGFVRRNGRSIGALAGPQANILFTCDELHGEPLDVAWASRPASYRITSPDDARFGPGLSPAAVHRKSRPYDFCRTADVVTGPQDHFLYLKLPVALQSGKRYTV